MGSPSSDRQPPGQRPIVAFDFDGTLITRDSYAAFVRWQAGPWRGLVGGLRLTPALLAYAVARDRGALKAATARIFLKGLTPEQLTAAAERFAESHAARLFRPDALACWRDWQAKGAYMVIVTATPDLVIKPFARRLGADLLIGTRLKSDVEGRITGDLEGSNCRGPEKVRRLEAQFGTGLQLAAAYGDTGGDREMLQMAEVKGYRVFTARP